MRLNCELALFPAGFTSTLNGSTLTGESVNVTAGALNITSLQDTSTFTSRQTNVGGSLSVDVATGRVSGSANYGKERQNGSFASVETQAGIQAGASGGRSAGNGSAGGGYTIDVRGNTNLTGAVIGSTADASKNKLTTGTLTTSDIQNRETYSASSLNLSGGMSIGNSTGSESKGTLSGRDKDGNATSDPAKIANRSQGVNLGGGISATGGLPSAMGARGGQSGTTNSAIDGTIIIRTGADGVADAASIAVANTVSRNTAGANDGALTQQFDAAKRDEIQEAFRVTRETANQTSIFFANRAAEEKTAKDKATAAEQALKDGYTLDKDGKPVTLTPEQIALYNSDKDTKGSIANLKEQAANLNSTFGSGSPLRLATTAFNAAASGGNAAGGLGSLAQGAVVGVLQSLAVNQIKHLADSLMTKTEVKDKDGNVISVTYTANAKSEAARAFLQGAAGCGFAAAGGGDCGSGALGAGGVAIVGSILNNAIGAGSTVFIKGADGKLRADPRSLEQQQAFTQLAGTLVGVMAATTGLDAPTTVVAGVFEAENNTIATPLGKTQPVSTTGQGYTHEERKNRIAELEQKANRTAVEEAELNGHYSEIAKWESLPAKPGETPQQSAQNWINAEGVAGALSPEKLSYLGGLERATYYFRNGGNAADLDNIIIWNKKTFGVVTVDDLIGLQKIHGGSAGLNTYLSGKSIKDIQGAISDVRTTGLDAAQRFAFNDNTLAYYAANQNLIDSKLTPDQAKGIRAVFALVKFETAANPNPGFWSGTGMGLASITTSISNGTMFSGNTAKAAVNTLPNGINSIIGLISTVGCIGSDVMSGCEEQAIAAAPRLPTFTTNCTGILGATQCGGGEILGNTALIVAPTMMTRGGSAATTAEGAVDNVSGTGTATLDTRLPLAPSQITVTFRTPANVQSEIVGLFSKTNPQNSITIGGRSVVADATNTGGAKIFNGVSDAEVFSYFQQLTGKPLPAARSLGANRDIYTIVTPQGNFTLRNFSKSQAQSAAKWTIDVPKKVAGTGNSGVSEIKFTGP